MAVGVSDRIQAQVEVTADSASYPILIGADLLSDAKLLTQMLEPHIAGGQVLLLTNSTVERFYGDAVRQALGDWQTDLFTMGDGEQHKSLATYGRVMDFLMTQRHSRATTVVALGGGVVGS